VAASPVGGTTVVGDDAAIGVASVLGAAVVPVGDGDEIGPAEPAAEQPDMSSTAQNKTPARDIARLREFKPPALGKRLARAAAVA
jgi:hypothetical protein